MKWFQSYLGSWMFFFLLFLWWASLPRVQAQVNLPIEVMGIEGMQADATLSLTNEQVASTRHLWLQTHNIRYPEKASLRINGGSWVPLNNTSATMLGTSQIYGGIGGSFAVLKMTLPISSSQLLPGNNTITFRFNVSDGLSVGYRIVNLDLLDASGNPLLPASAFTRENPATWLPPLSATADIAAGETLWRNANLVASYRPGAQPIMAKCASCHTQNGADLQYFSYSNHAIIERSKFHGLSATQGSQIASYIRTLAVKRAGRPWNPPYQPGPGLTDKPNDEWLAGAGIENVLDDDADTLKALFPNGVRRDAIMEGDTNKFKRFSGHDTPLAFQLPDWNHWLPEVHPLDGLPLDFPTSGSLATYNKLRSQLVGKTAVQIREWMRTSSLGDSSAGVVRSGMFLLEDFYGDSISDLARARYPTLVTASGSIADPTVARHMYSFVLWRMVKHVEIHEEFGLTGLGRVPESDWPYYEPRDALPRTWVGSNRTVFDSSPFLSGLEFNTTGSTSGNNVFNHDYLSNSWYQLQSILNGGQRTGGGHKALDFGYAYGFLDHIERHTKSTQMGRHYVWSLKGMDEGDNDRGPNHPDGWSFNRASLGPLNDYLSPDNPAATPVVSTFSRAALNLLVQVWLEKNNTWLPEQIFTHPDGTEKSGDEDGVHFETRFWVVGSGSGEDKDRSIAEGTFGGMTKIKAQNTMPPALLNGYAQWAQAVWPGLDVNGNARNDWMQFTVPRVGSAPSAPSVMQAATYGDVRISWTPAAGVISYNVKRSTTPAGPFLTVAYFRTSGEYTDSVPLQNREYYYKLSANIATGESPDSAATVTDLLRDRLLGTFIGTTPTRDAKTREATDGDRHTIGTAFSDPSNNWAPWTGLDFGSAQPIARIGYISSRSYSKRLIGGKFEASNSPTFSTDVINLHTISSDPGDGYKEINISVPGTYRYVRYLLRGANDAFDTTVDGRMAEITFWKAPPVGEGPAGFTYIAEEGQSYTFGQTVDVAYGANGSFHYLYGRTGDIAFNDATFGNPLSGVGKKGYYRISPVVEDIAAPTFSLSGGAYIGSRVVTLTTTTAGATIRYTTNGFYPTATTGTLISGSSGSVILTPSSGPIVLKARAFRSGATDSEMTSITYTIADIDRTDESGGTITARASYNSAENQAKAFDNLTATKWMDPSGIPSSVAPSWIQFEFAGSGYAINSYSIISAHDEPARDPKSWRLKASNATTPDWNTATVLDTQTDQTFANRSEKRTYPIENTAVYTKYRLEITENYGSRTMTQFAELDLVTTDTGILYFRSIYGLAPEGSQDLHTPANDGVGNLLKYAFNMVGNGVGQKSSLAMANNSIVTNGGYAGLPEISRDASGRLTVTYIRRSSSSLPGIGYSVEFSDSLSTFAVNSLATETLEIPDTTIERVTVRDSVAAAHRFARVKVTVP